MWTYRRQVISKNQDFGQLESQWRKEQDPVSISVLWKHETGFVQKRVVNPKRRISCFMLPESLFCRYGQECQYCHDGSSLVQEMWRIRKKLSFRILLMKTVEFDRIRPEYDSHPDF